MNKLIILGIASTLGAATFALFPANPPVELQPTSPGTAQTGHLNVSGTATVGLLKSQGTVFGQSTAPTGFAYGGFFTAASNQARGFYGYASSPTGLTYGGFFQNASSQGRAVYGLATGTTADNYGGYFQAAGTSARGVLGVASAATGTTYGVYGRAVSPDGYGVYSNGKFGATGGAVFRSNLVIAASDKVDESPLEVRGQSSSTSKPMVDILNTQSGGEWRWTLSHKAIEATSSGPGACGGITGYGESTGGGLSVGVRGSGYGTGLNYGVYGTCAFGSTNYAAYFDGLLYATSSTASVKAFMIDHPLDPENKVLSHSSVESNERMNVYRGVVKTDAQGFSWVVVPNWFHALNADIQYQLTVVGDESADFVLAKIARELQSGKFRIRTSKPGTKVCWQITGRRHDPTSEYYPLEVERMKNKDERGKYYEPEAYGKDKSLGMGYIPTEGGAASKRHLNPPSTK